MNSRRLIRLVALPRVNVQVNNHRFVFLHGFPRDPVVDIPAEHQFNESAFLDCSVYVALPSVRMFGSTPSMSVVFQKKNVSIILQL